MKAEIDITPELALRVLRSLPELIPTWIKQRGGVYKLYRKLGYISPQSCDAAFQRRKKSGWNFKSMVKTVEAIISSPILGQDD